MQNKPRIVNMNLSTHVMFGILVGGLFFGKPEIVLMVGLVP
jgi:hypothetical protein